MRRTGKIGVVIFLFLSAAHPAQASGVDILLRKLVEKGVLSPSEAREIRAETNEEIVKGEKQKQEEYKETASKSIPDWVKNIKLKGDLRLRYQYKHDDSTTVPKDTHIGRVRLRLGLEARVNDKLKAGLGIASGSGDPRSTNITFGNYNEKKTVVLDYAYAKYDPVAWLNITGGKMLLADTFWAPTDLIWDTDITPEGGVFGLSRKIGADSSVFLKTGVLIVDDDTSSDANPPMAYLVQAGATYEINEKMSVKGAVSLQAFDNIKGHVSSSYSSQSNTGNTTKGVSRYTYDYQMVNPALELSVKEPFTLAGYDIESLKLFGEFVNNFDVSKGGNGFALGFKCGKNKVEKWGDWQFKYLYAMLGRDAALDVLPDSDRYGGRTGMRSHEGELTFGLGKNTFLGIDVYRSWSIVSSKAPETLVQADWNLKF
ncbi:MAG: putative porin [Candidatus Omnitrophota bacterium]